MYVYISSFHVYLSISVLCSVHNMYMLVVLMFINACECCMHNDVGHCKNIVTHSFVSM